MKKVPFLIIMLLLSSGLLFSQVAVNSDGTQPHGSAILDVKSTVKGFLPPRMTLVQRDAIQNPAEGLIVFCTDCGTGNSSAVSLYTGGIWKILPAYCMIEAPLSGTHVASAEQIVWMWNPAEFATGYKWNYTDDYSSAIDMGMNTSYTETGLSCSRLYRAYVWAYNICGDNSDVTVLSQSTLADNPAPPAAGTQVPLHYGIEWNWNAVPDATGYRLNYVDDFSTAFDMGTVLTWTETGLDCGTEYSIYVWAYSDCGVSTATALTQTTNPCWTCGDSFSLYHMAGEVAPVSKTVNYGTVTGIAGEPAKCWITSNLGADHQATSVNDATEASGGWYWQFNLKQGYQFAGTTVTPSWVITSITQFSHWTYNNDPCSIEIGAGFRIPTQTEWNNVQTAGGWTDWNGPWNSALKLHAAGYLDYYDGWLNLPGSVGTYWSSTWSSLDWAWTLDFASTYSRIYSWEMAYGYSVRCIQSMTDNPAVPGKPVTGNTKRGKGK